MEHFRCFNEVRRSSPRDLSLVDDKFRRGWNSMLCFCIRQTYSDYVSTTGLLFILWIFRVFAMSLEWRLGSRWNAHSNLYRPENGTALSTVTFAWSIETIETECNIHKLPFIGFLSSWWSSRMWCDWISFCFATIILVLEETLNLLKLLYGVFPLRRANRAPFAANKFGANNKAQYHSCGHATYVTTASRLFKFWLRFFLS